MTKRLLYHIGFWVLYVLFKSYLNFDSGSIAVHKKSDIELFLFAIFVQFVLVAIKIPLVYSLFYIIDKYLAKQWSIIKSLCFSIALFISAIILYLFVNQLLAFNFFNSKINLWQNLNSLNSLIYSFFILAFVSGLAVSIKLFRLSIKQKADSQELLKKKLEIELQFLKAQTNPHFLFNTLNNIYGLARKNADQTADVVLKLSSMLRYMLYETANETVAIENEILIINDYIELEKLRYSNKLEVVFDHSIDNLKQKIAPLILLPFVENAFKHGAGESRFKSYIHAKLQVENTLLLFEIKNSKEGITATESTNQIGLKNIQRQLELIYPNHKLTIENAENEFVAKIQINLNDGKI